MSATDLKTLETACQETADRTRWQIAAKIRELVNNDNQGKITAQTVVLLLENGEI